MEGYDDMTQMYLTGYSVIQIAKEFGITREAVYNRLRLMPDWEGIKSIRKHNRGVQGITEPHIQLEIYNKWKSGVSIPTLSQEYKASYNKIRSVILLFNGTIRRNQKRDDLIRKDYKENNLTQYELSAKYNLAQSRINRIINASPPKNHS